MDKPKFQNLSPDQVNELIATKIMGWHKEFYRYGEDPEYISPYESWVDAGGIEQKQVIYTVHAQCSCSLFTPFTSHDDCWIAEDKLLSMPSTIFDIFLQHLMEIVIRDLGGMDYFELSKRQKEVAVKTYHATPSQRCEAMLKAIGELQ